MDNHMAEDKNEQDRTHRTTDAPIPGQTQSTRPTESVAPQQYFRANLPSFNQPYWVKHARRTAYPMLAGKLNVDVAVIGGGITGLTAAMCLIQSGKKVALIDMNVVGGGTTGHSTGHLDNNSDQSLRHVLNKFGEDRGRLI